jgi:hypothetical protein
MMKNKDDWIQRNWAGGKRVKSLLGYSMEDIAGINRFSDGLIKSDEDT